MSQEVQRLGRKPKARRAGGWRSAIPQSAIQNPQPRILVPRLIGWFLACARNLPWRRTLDPYAVWVSEIMLQQTQVKTVIPYWERWMRELPTVRAAAGCPEPRLLKLWEGLGYYRRARHLQKAARLIVKEHGGEFPRDLSRILGLPGVGRYTAGAIASIAFNQPAPILDGNVIRVLTRLFAITGNPREHATKEQLWQLADRLVQDAEKVDDAQLQTRNPQLRLAGPCSAFNQSLMELGATVCLPREPRCGECPVQRQCLARRRNVANQLPSLGKRPRSTERRFIAFVAEHKGRFLVRRRAGDAVNGGLWEWPNMERPSRGEVTVAALAGSLGLKLAGHEPLAVIRHSITRYRNIVSVFRAKPLENSRERGNDQKWLPLARLDKLPFPSAHRRIVEKLKTDAAPAHFRRQSK